MLLSKNNIESALKSWRVLNSYLLQLNYEEVDQLLAAEMAKADPRMAFVMRIHSRLAKLASQRMDAKRLALIDHVRRKHHGRKK